ncbi:MAG: sulfatase-like hydrolase/transferase [Proteobacteria bacterium]|nr:sulfatase-like hydrolase/transferase [Pseudomonadota bacterium]
MIRSLALFALVLSGCPSEEPEPEPELPPKVLVIGIDGLRGDGIGGAETPTLDSLIDGGAWTMTATTQLGAPTVSGPGWTSILTGVDADKHLIYSNGGWDQIDRAYPTFLKRASDLGFGTGAAIHWLPIHVDIIEDDVLDEAVPNADDDAVADGMAAMLTDFDLDVHFVHLDDVDGAGHSSGFSIENPEYVAEIEEVDGQIGRILDALEARPTRDEERWVVIVTSDHGGSGTSHGGVTDDHRLIPLIVAGDGVSPGELAAGSHLDVHATVMKYLGHPPEASWGLDGVPRDLGDS